MPALVVEAALAADPLSRLVLSLDEQQTRQEIIYWYYFAQMALLSAY